MLAKYLQNLFVCEKIGREVSFFISEETVRFRMKSYTKYNEL